MSKFNKTFAGGTPLASADLNALVASHNDTDNELNKVKNSIGFDESGETHLNAWGVIIDPNSANSAVEVVGNFNFWTEFKENIGRYQVSNDGTKAIKLNPLNSEEYIDGTPVDHSKGHIMVHVPDLHYRVYESPTTGKSTLWMSASSLGGHAIHTSGQGKGSWIGAYLANSSDSTHIQSRPGAKPLANKTINQFFNLAQANSQDFGLSDYEQRKLMLMLYLSEYRNLNSQASLGLGMTGNGGNWDAAENAPTGTTATLGDGCGTVAYTENNSIEGACHVSLFGIEDPYGWFWEMIQGCYFGNSENAAQDGTEMFFYEGNRMPTSSELATHPSGNYRQLVRLTSSANIYSLIMGERFDILPKKSGSGGYGDYSYANNTGQLLLWGADALDGSGAGLVCSRSGRAWTATLSDFAARLALYGSPTLVSLPSEM